MTFTIESLRYFNEVLYLIGSLARVVRQVAQALRGLVF